jgi:hypothetical protein
MNADDLEVRMSCTRSYLPYAVASLCSLRQHNRAVPVRLFVDEEVPELTAIADRAGFTVERVDPVSERVRAVHGDAGDHIRSRLLKIHTMATATAERVLYLDADTLLLGDVGAVGAAVEGSAEDLFMLLRRPLVPTLWDYGRMNLTDPQRSREDIAELIQETFALGLTLADLDRLTCWNAGILYGASDTARTLAVAWLDTYERMITASTRDAFVPNDQLCLWLTLLGHDPVGDIGELPLGWNCMPGLALGLAAGTPSLPDSDLDGVTVLHLATNKRDPWAVRRMTAALDAAGVVLPWSLPDPIAG